MSSAYLEIIQLENGDFALQRADENESEPLVTITFSKEALAFLQEHEGVVAKAMFNGGIQAVGAITRKIAEAEERSTQERVIH